MITQKLREIFQVHQRIRLYRKAFWQNISQDSSEIYSEIIPVLMGLSHLAGVSNGSRLTRLAMQVLECRFFLHFFPLTETKPPGVMLQELIPFSLYKIETWWTNLPRESCLVALYSTKGVTLFVINCIYLALRKAPRDLVVLLPESMALNILNYLYNTINLSHSKLRERGVWIVSDRDSTMLDLVLVGKKGTVYLCFADGKSSEDGLIFKADRTTVFFRDDIVPAASQFKLPVCRVLVYVRKARFVMQTLSPMTIDLLDAQASRYEQICVRIFSPLIEIIRDNPQIWAGWVNLKKVHIASRRGKTPRFVDRRWIVNYQFKETQLIVNLQKGKGFLMPVRIWKKVRTLRSMKEARDLARRKGLKDERLLGALIDLFETVD